MTTLPAAARSRARRGLALALAAVAAAFVLRAAGLDALLPHRPWSDERNWAGQVELLRQPRAVAEQHEGYGFYPHLVPRLALLVQPEPERAAGDGESEHARAAGRDVVVLRTISVLLSAGGPLATWLLARRLVSARAALIAAWLVAASLLTAWHAPQARPHGAATTLVVLGVWAATSVRRRPGFASGLAAGTVVAAAAGVLQAGFGLLLPVAAAVALARGARPAARAAALAGAVLPLLASLPFTYPFAFVERSTDPAALQGGHGLMGQAGLSWQTFDGSGFGVLASTLWSFEPFLCLLAAGAGIALLVRRVRRGGATSAVRGSVAPRARGDRADAAERAVTAEHGDTPARADAWIALSFALPYALAFGAYAVTFPRYLLHLLPFVAILVAGTADALLGDPRAALRRAAAALVLVCLAGQLALCVQLARLRLRPDTLEEAAAVLRRDAGPATGRAATFASVDLPLRRTAAGFATLRVGAQSVWATPWARHQWRAGPPAHGGFDLRTFDTRGNRTVQELHAAVERELRALAPCRLVLDAADLARRNPLAARVRASASSGLVARISPARRDDGDERPMLVRDQGDEWRGETSWAWRLVHARALGPLIEIHEVAP